MTFKNVYRSKLGGVKCTEWRVVGKFASNPALSVPKNTGGRGLYKTMGPLYGVPL